MGPEIAQSFGEKDFTIEKFNASGNKYEMTLMSLKDIHLHSNIKGEFEPNGNITYVYLFDDRGLYSINSVYKFHEPQHGSFKQPRERSWCAKSDGIGTLALGPSIPHGIVSHHVFAFVFSLGLAYLLLPLFNKLSSKHLDLPPNDPLFYIVVFGGSVIIGLIAGLYPSFFLSAFKPVNVLKGNVALGMKSGFIRSTLVVFQFVVSVFLIIGAIAVNRQLTLSKQKTGI